jgi:uncharacterized membrane protein
MTQNQASSGQTGGGPVYFDASLHPNRSLSLAGFWIVMALIAGVSFAAGVAFYLQGAWPVVGFFGLDVALVYWAFKASYRSGRLHEKIRLTDDVLEVQRVSPFGRVEVWRYQPYWVRVDIDDPPEHHSQLTLRSHGRSLTVGAFLAPAQRLEVAQALRAALREQDRVGQP